MPTVAVGILVKVITPPRPRWDCCLGGVGPVHTADAFAPMKMALSGSRSTICGFVRLTAPSVGVTMMPRLKMAGKPLTTSVDARLFSAAMLAVADPPFTVVVTGTEIGWCDDARRSHGSRVDGGGAGERAGLEFHAKLDDTGRAGGHRIFEDPGQFATRASGFILRILNRTDVDRSGCRTIRVHEPGWKHVFDAWVQAVGVDTGAFVVEGVWNSSPDCTSIVDTVFATCT